MVGGEKKTRADEQGKKTGALGGFGGVSQQVNKIGLYCYVRYLS